MSYYAFTVKKLGSHISEITEKSYEPFFKKLYKFGKEVFKMAELDPHGRLHYHGIIWLKRNFFRKKLRTKGFHWCLRSVWDMSSWIVYCYKNYSYEHYDDSISLIEDNNISLLCNEEVGDVQISVMQDDAKRNKAKNIMRQHLWEIRREVRKLKISKKDVIKFYDPKMK